MNIKGVIRKKPIYMSLGILVVLIAVSGITYAIFSQTDINTNNQIVSSGTLAIDLGTCTSLTTNMLPTSNIEGMQLPGCTIEVENTGSLPAAYKIKLYNNPNPTTPGDLLDYLSHELLWISFDNGTPLLISDLVKENELIIIQNDAVYIIYEGVVEALDTKYHNIKVWIDEEADTSIIGKKINLIVEVEAIVNPPCNNSLLDIAIDKDVNMIPVSYENGITVKADETNADSSYEWYNYCDQKWANVVLVEASGVNSRETYKSAIPGTPINEADILAYFVYVPRYKYKIFNNSDPIVGVPEQTIDVTFENKTVAKSNGSANWTWLTHPAFTFGTTELNGIWVGKFETSGYMGDETTATCVNSVSAINCDNENILPVSKPNTKTIRYQTISNQFTTSLKFKSNSMYGISSSTIDSHMMKNMEWGAVAYLSQSIYGKQGNPLYEGDLKLVGINNSSGFITGRSAGAPGEDSGGTNIPQYQTFFGVGSSTNKFGTAGYYVWDDSRVICTGTCTASNSAITEYGLGAKETGKGTAASTTGTQYGIYDMVGGTAERVMGNMAANGVSIPGAINPGNSGFTMPYPDPKYYDSYLYGTTMNDIAAFTRGHLGDATRETLTCISGAYCGWYGAVSSFPYFTSNVWIGRGGGYTGGRAMGIYLYAESTGASFEIAALRSTLVVE